MELFSEVLIRISPLILAFFFGKLYGELKGEEKLLKEMDSHRDFLRRTIERIK
jgi:hypothetical protein